LHFDNARPHLVEDKIAELQIRRLPHPPYSPDLAPSDFSLFGYLKGVLKGQMFDDEQALFTAIIDILQSIDRETLQAVYDEWLVRLQRCIESGGEYVID
jgi:histone-lysine N-methyltransferase SETMAR